MKFNKVRFILLSLICIFIYDCYNDDYNNDLRLSKNNTKNTSNKTNFEQVIISQLNSISGDSDSFIINSNINPFNALNFKSVHDFCNFKNDVKYILNSDVISVQPSTYQSQFRVVHSEISVLNILIDQKLYNDDICQNYNFINLFSNLKGNIIGKYWIQQGFNSIIFNGTNIINFNGRLSYKFFIGDISVIYNDERSFKLIIDIITGVPLSIMENEDF